MAESRTNSLDNRPHIILADELGCCQVVRYPTDGVSPGWCCCYLTRILTCRTPRARPFPMLFNPNPYNIYLILPALLTTVFVGLLVFVIFSPTPMLVERRTQRQTHWQSLKREYESSQVFSKEVSRRHVPKLVCTSWLPNSVFT